MGAKEDAIQTLENSAEDFAEAVLGEEVRQGLVNVANALKAVVEGYATVVTDDLTDDDPNTAAQASAVRNELNKTLQNKGTLTSCSFNDVDAINALWTLTANNTYTDIPSELDGTNSAGILAQVQYYNSPSRVQILLTRDGDIFSRMKYGNTWDNWSSGVDAQFDLLTKELQKYGTIDVLYDQDYGGRVHNGVTFSWNANNLCYMVSGTPTSSAIYNFWDSPQGLPFGFEKGKTYYAKCKISNNKIRVEAYYYYDDVIQVNNPIVFTDDREFSIPLNADNKILFRIYVLQSAIGTELNDTVNFAVLNPVGNSINNNYSYTIQNNTYNVTATPTINSGIPYVLISTGDNTDRTADIAAVLSNNGACMLGTGTFYVTNLSINEEQSLRGCGIGNTIIRMADSASGSAVSLGTRSSISDLTVDGGLRTKPTENGGRNGIAWTGTYISAENPGNVPYRGQISNVHVLGFSGGGIICSNTGTSWAAGLNAVNVNIHLCWAGIYIPIYSEYNRFTNIEVDACYYGVINNGGNNMFANCGFNANDIGFYIDNGNGQSPNDSHGSAVGCTFNHSGNNSGTAIKLDGVSAGYVFSGCQIFFGSLDIKNSVGVQFANCNFGRSVPISVNGGGLILFTGNIHRESPSVTKTNTPIVKTTNCYLRDGTEITI